MKFESEYFVGIKDIGKNGLMTNFAFLSSLEEIASLHSSKVGYGVNDIEIKKRVWILMDWKLKVFERPKYGDKILLKTWARPINKHIFYTYRDFSVYIGERQVAIATSKWVLLDIEKNKICKIEDDILNLYKPESEKVFEEEEILKLTEPKQNQEMKMEYEVKRADIDVNNHMHNLNYLKLAYEILPEEIYNTNELNNVRIMYKHQIKLKDNVKCFYINQEERHIISIKSSDEKVLHAIVELK